jgi:glycosyltransferase involved in cell wall biosynthesis
MVVHLRNSRLSRLEVVMLRSLACTPNPVRYIAVSGGAACTIEGLPKDAVTVLGDAVSAPRARGTRGLNDPARVGLVLNQQPTKGLDIFVEAVAKLASSNIQWEVFGSAGIVPPPAGYVAESMSRLSQMGVADKVHFRGIVPSMTAEFQKLDAFLITSRRESFSRVAAEALMSGLPLVAPVIPGLIETVDGGRLAHMYPLADASAAASAVQVVLSDYHSALSMAQIGMRWGESRFSADAVAGEMRKLYTELLVRPTSARSRS